MKEQQFVDVIALAENVINLEKQKFLALNVINLVDVKSKETKVFWM